MRANAITEDHGDADGFNGPGPEPGAEFEANERDEKGNPDTSTFNGCGLTGDPFEGNGR